MSRLFNLLATHWPQGTQLAAKCATYEGDIGPKGHSLPLRIAGGLHALVLQDADAQLATVYPPNIPADETFKSEILTALARHDAFLCDWVAEAPQTNEVRRSAALIATARLLAAKFQLPFKLSELGASGGLNLMFDQFHLAVGDGYGPESTVNLAPDWTGPLPPIAKVEVTDRRGVDLNPLNSANSEDALKLQAYLWPDQSERLLRTRAAMALNTAQVDKADAIDWLQDRLKTPMDGYLHLVYSTVAWQYFPAEKQKLGTQAMQTAGAQATDTAPLAWLSYEADADPRGAALTLRVWPGNLTLNLGRADFHGRWIDWKSPADFP